MVRSLRRRVAVLVAVALTATVTGCAPGRQQAKPQTSSPPPSTQLWSVSMRPIGQPFPVGEVVVGAVTEDRELFVVGIDPANGTVLWKQAASPGEVVPGVSTGPVRVGDNVAYFRPDPTGNLYARLVVADPRTGTDLAASPPLLFGSLPLPCADNTDVCTLSRRNYQDGYRTHRLRVDTNQYVLEDTGLPPRARLIGEDGLVDFGQRDPEIIGLVRGGKLVWQTPLSQAFPAGFSTDNGWYWARYPEQKVYAGSVYGETEDAPGGAWTRDLAQTSASAGLSEEDGTVLWRDQGSDLWCSGRVAVPADRDDPNSPLIPVRCRVKGVATYREGTAPSYTGLDVIIEGFDVTTGKTTWSVPVQDAKDVAGAGERPAVAGPTQVVIQAGSGPLVVDVATGAHHAAPADAVFWCLKFGQFEYREPYYRRGEADTTRYGGYLASACDATGSPAEGLPNSAATAAVGARVGPYAVVATADEFIGFRVA